MQRIEITPFQTSDYSFRRYPRRRERRARRLTNAAAMLGRLGVCGAVCALALVLRSVDTPVSLTTEQPEQQESEQSDTDEMLGRLRFVELPTALAVFAQSRSLTAPARTEYVTVEDEGRLARLICQSGADVVACGAGVVRGVGEDAGLGRYVCLLLDDGNEISHYGLAEILVENGQSVRELDNIGTVGSSGVLSLAASRAGRPLEVTDIFDLTDE